MKTKNLFALGVIVLFIGASFLPICSSMTATVKEKMENEESDPLTSEGYWVKGVIENNYGNSLTGRVVVSINKLTLPLSANSGIVSGSYSIQLPEKWFQKFGSFTATVSAAVGHYYPDEYRPTFNRDTHVYWVNFSLDFDNHIKPIQKFPVYNLLQTQFPLFSKLLNIMAVFQ